MAVRVDTNAGETALFTALQARLGAEQVVRERLDVGDVALMSDAGALLVERKTWADLAKSLTDGRYAEQKARLLAAAAAAAPAPPAPPASGPGAIEVDDDEDREEAPQEQEDEQVQVLATGGGGGISSTGVLYLIEGPLKGWGGTVGGAMSGLSKMKNAQLEAALVLTAVRDGVPVLRAKDPAHTVELLVYVLGKLRAGELRPGAPGNGGGGGGGYASLLKKRKRDNMSTATTWEVMLAQPPGMSARKAAAVAAAYPSMAKLAAATEAELAAVRVPEAARGSTPAATAGAGGGAAAPAAAAGRRLGPAVAKTLVALLR